MPVLDKLGIKIDLSTTPASGPHILVPGTAIRPGPRDQSRLLNGKLEALEKELSEFPAGRECIRLFQKHVNELVHLVHQRRRVKVTWHRYQGPAFVALFMNAILDRDTTIPAMVTDVHVSTLLENMKAVLKQEGSPPLQGDLDRYGSLAQSFFCGQTKLV